jgi:hypothetical protein
MLPIHNEARIRIGDTLLTYSQSATVRVALNSYLVEMSAPGALGDDERGREMAATYARNCKELLELISWAMRGEA